MVRAALVAGLVALSCSGAEPPPDILLVVIDTVRADRTSTYGYERPTTIQLDAVARAGVVFEDAMAPAPWTWPSHASLFTGEQPWVHGARLAAHPLSKMRTDLPTLAEELSDAGYRTVSLVTNGWLRPELGLVRGFEVAQHFEQDSDVVEAAHREIASDDERPLFLFVNLLSAHSPYVEGPGMWAAPDPSSLRPETAPDWLRPYLVVDPLYGIDLALRPHADGKSGVTAFLSGSLEIPPEGMALLSHLYDAGVRVADYGLGRIVEKWAERYPAGVVAVTSDHGEALSEHGHMHHMALVYRELLHVPLVLAAPGRLPAGLRISAPVAIVDLHPTLLELALGRESPRSLLRWIDGTAEARPIVAAAEAVAIMAEHAGGRYEKSWRLYREGDWALVGGSDGGAELYDLASDPGMEHDRAASNPAKLGELSARARAYYKANPAYQTEAAQIPEDMREKLQALGYVATEF